MSLQNNKKSKFAILFVDDEEMARKYFTLTFQKDYEILTAESVDEATIVLAEKHQQIGVLITDQRMPGKLGVDLLKKARADYPAIVRLLTTAYSDLDDAVAAVNGGEILRYISKPWDFDQLGHELNNAMRFFELKHERDQLLGEKLSVVQHMAAVNRARDLIMLASGITHCKRSLTAMASLLAQLKVMSIELSEERHLEMWGNIEHEIGDMLSLSDVIKANTKLDGNDLVSINLTDHCDNLASQYHNIVLINQPDHSQSNIETVPIAIDRIFKLLSDDNNAQIDLTLETSPAEDDELIIKINLKGSSKNLEKINGNLISIFLLSYHLGGKVALSKTKEMELNIYLPKSPKDVTHDNIEHNWLDQIFSQYEQ